MTIRALTAFLATTGALWATAGESQAQSFVDDGSAYVGGYQDPALGYAPAQYGPVRVVAGPLGLDVVQNGDGSVVAHVVQSQVSLDQLYDTRLLLGFQGVVGGDSVTLTYSPANNAYYGTLPSGATLGAAPAYAQVLFPDVVVAPPPVVHVVPYPRAPVVVHYPRRHVRPRFVVRPHFPHRPALPPVVRVDPRGGSWQRAHVVRRWDGRGHDGRGHDGRGHDRRGHGGRGHDGRGHDGRGHGGHRR